MENEQVEGAEAAAAAELEVAEWRVRVRDSLQELGSELDSFEPGWRDVLLPLVDEADPFEIASVRFLLDTAEKHGGLAWHLIGQEVAEFDSDHLNLPGLREEAERIPWASDALLAHVGVEGPASVASPSVPSTSPTSQVTHSTAVTAVGEDLACPPN